MNGLIVYNQAPFQRGSCLRVERLRGCGPSQTTGLPRDVDRGDLLDEEFFTPVLEKIALLHIQSCMLI